MATTTKKFFPADRYRWDFGICSPSKGFAQVDTSVDAWYYGTWANPTTFTIVNYCEGDVYTTVADSALDFCDEIHKIVNYCKENGHHFKGIDPMLVPDLEQKFRDVGLGDLLF